MRKWNINNLAKQTKFCQSMLPRKLKVMNRLSNVLLIITIFKTNIFKPNYLKWFRKKIANLKPDQIMRIIWTRYRNELIFLIATTICLDNWTYKVNLLNSKRSFRSENEQHCLNFTCIGNCLGVTLAGLSLKTINLSSNLFFCIENHKLEDISLNLTFLGR